MDVERLRKLEALGELDDDTVRDINQLLDVFEAAREWADSGEVDHLLPKRAELRLLEAIEATVEYSCSDCGATYYGHHGLCPAVEQLRDAEEPDE